MKRIFLCCLPWSLTLMTAFAQVDTATIAGSVRDSSGAGLASASVIFVDVATNATTKAQADAIDYAAPPLRLFLSLPLRLCYVSYANVRAEHASSDKEGGRDGTQNIYQAGRRISIDGFPGKHHGEFVCANFGSE